MWTTDDDAVVLGIGKNGRCVSLPGWIVTQLILIQFADRPDDLVRLAKRNFNKLELVRSKILTALVEIPGKDFDLLKLRLCANDNQARAVLVGKDLRTRSVRRYLIIEQPLGQVSQLLAVAILQSHHPHLALGWGRGRRHRFHDLVDHRELFLRRRQHQPAARFIRQNQRPGHSRKLGLLHPLIDQLLNRLHCLVELARLAARQTDGANLAFNHQSTTGPVLLKECHNALMLRTGGQDDEPLAARVLDHLRRRALAWLVIFKQLINQRLHLAGFRALEIDKAHGALRRGWQNVQRLHDICHDRMLRGISRHNHPVVFTIWNQPGAGLLLERHFIHALIHQRLNIAVDAIHLVVRQRQHRGRARFSQRFLEAGLQLSNDRLCGPHVSR